MDNIAILHNTLDICAQGAYEKDQKRIPLKLQQDEMRAARVFLPDEVHELADAKGFHHVIGLGRCGYECRKLDSFTLAAEMDKHKWLFLYKERVQEILVLNFANAVNPGGGVRIGALAQEEDLCRRSSLLLSLEGPEARPYYAYNRSLHSNMGSDAIILSPKVEIIKDANGEPLDETVVVAVLTCAAPLIKSGLEGLTWEQYISMFYRRIMGILHVAGFMGYKALVLGAFGCGAFGNDAKLVSDLFYKALKEFRLAGLPERAFFNRIDFAFRPSSTYNYDEFYRNFGGGRFYRDEDEEDLARIMKEIRETEVYLDKIRGSLLGGAVGDALGYPVEFMRLDAIRECFGPKGITSYVTDPETGKALISDDTQMTLFTADGILVAETRGYMRGIGGTPHNYVPMSYQDWLVTQTTDHDTGSQTKRYNGKNGISWLLDVPELYHRRAPGNTCLSALNGNLHEKYGGDYIKDPRNNSKGCGGVMRVAPLGLHYRHVLLKTLDQEGAELAAITHGHSLGYMPAAVLTHILNRLIYAKGQPTLKEIVIEARDAIAELFADDAHITELTEIIDRAVALAENDGADPENIAQLGEGWVAEETLAIAIYCSLRYEHDFSGGVIASVNHSGDSDSTGAVTGNILGAINGFDSIGEEWKKDLELYDVILEMADDLCHGCHMEEDCNYYDPDWARKYMYMRWKDDPSWSPQAGSTGPQSPEDIVRSPTLDTINRLLRNGGVL